MSSRSSTVVLPFLCLLGAGPLLHPLESQIATSGGLPREQMVALAGQGGVLAVLGGLRSAFAGGCWLRANQSWERQDGTATTAWIELTVAADARPAYFWLNGARIMAYDMPAWLPETAPAAVRRQTSDEQARRGLDFLARGLRWHGPDADLYVEMANIQWRRLGDLEAAARLYRLAAEQTVAPYYAGRIHAELLCALHRPQEALDWLNRILPTLPPEVPEARRAVVLARIQALQHSLGHN